VASPEAQLQSKMLQEQEVIKYEQTVATIQPPPAQEPQVDPATGAPMPVDPMAEEQQMQAAIPPPPSINQHTPLKWLPWYKASIHKQEFLKWANSDRIVQLLQENTALEPLLTEHLQMIEQAVMEQMIAEMGPQPTPPQGAGMAMANSNQEAGSKMVSEGKA
jgi:hypothetical protein